MDTLEPSRTPAFEEIDGEVRSTWLDQKQQDVEDTYDVHDYTEEKRQALNAYAARLRGLQETAARLAARQQI